MQTLTVLKHPHATLRQPCAEISALSDDIRRLADDMLATMYSVNGIGLAAPQVGHSVRLLVADVSEERASPLQLANPRITQKDGSMMMEEGCLSVPGVRALVPRAQSVVVTGIGMDGDEKTFTATDLFAVCLQHEIDHLDGVLFFDHLSKFKRTRLLHKYSRQETQ